MLDYNAFLSRKFAELAPAGVDVSLMSSPTFGHQKALAEWAVKRGRSAIFADTGLGKTRIQLLWADAIVRATGGDILILAPLAVAPQTVMEGGSIGIDVSLCRENSDVKPGVNITNYDRIHKFDPSRFVGVVLDESSIIKHHDTKTLAYLLSAFGRTQYKLCATATPAPNDWTELGTHAEFLGVCTRAEMLAEFFIHDGGETQVWRLKGHAQDQFWRWVAQWGAMVRRPSDLGFDDASYQLPPLQLIEHTIRSDLMSGELFPSESLTLSDRRAARRESIEERVQACADRVNAEHVPWVVWCDLNAESEMLSKAIPGAVEVRGSMDADEKERALMGFASGAVRVLVTKPSIAGFGLNWQHCSRMAFVGVTDSWESYYQAVRRCWRFGQSKDVQVHIFATEREGAIVANLKRKERDALMMADQLSAYTKEAVRESVLGAIRQTNTYAAEKAVFLPTWIKEAA